MGRLIKFTGLTGPNKPNASIFNNCPTFICDCLTLLFAEACNGWDDEVKRLTIRK
jgi:hypothetical protein